jgi:hypothetical protein
MTEPTDAAKPYGVRGDPNGLSFWSRPDSFPLRFIIVFLVALPGAVSLISIVVGLLWWTYEGHTLYLSYEADVATANAMASSDKALATYNAARLAAPTRPTLDELVQKSRDDAQKAGEDADPVNIAGKAGYSDGWRGLADNPAKTYSIDEKTGYRRGWMRGAEYRDVAKRAGYPTP